MVASGFHVLVVDDNDLNAQLLEEILTNAGYEVEIAVHGKDALERVASRRPDLILLDVMMPHVDGFEVCRRLKYSNDTRMIPIVLLTALADIDNRIRGIEAGADDFISKPFDRYEVLARAKALLRMKRLNDELDDAETVIFALAEAIEFKDAYTVGHTQRVSRYAQRLARAAGLSEDEVEALRKGGILHDVGKIGVPDAVLNKAGPLDRDELGRMREHPSLGTQICGRLRSVQSAIPVIRWHHERLDGSGYPDGLKGGKIPVIARILAVADVYDALNTQRSYKPAHPPSVCFETLQDEVKKGYWDPDLVKLFIEIMEKALATSTASAASAEAPQLFERDR